MLKNAIVRLVLIYLAFETLCLTGRVHADASEALSAALQSFSTSTTDLDFGDLSTGASPTTMFSLSNSSSSPLQIERIESTNADFQIDNSQTTCPVDGGQMPPGSCMVSVRFRPSKTGSVVGMLRILISNALIQVVRLHGYNGLPPTSSVPSVNMPDLPEAQNVTGAFSGNFSRRESKRPPPSGPARSVPPGTTIGPPALRSPDAFPQPPLLPDTSFSGGGPVTINGSFYQGTPEDAAVAVGNGYVLAASNDQITIHQTDGTLIANKKQVDFWSSINLNHGITDPTVAYNRQTNQFYMAAIDFELSDILYLAVSKARDPNGTWYLFSLPACPPDSAFGDRPIMAAGFYDLLITTQCPDSTAGLGGLYAINQQNLADYNIGGVSVQPIPNYYSPVTESDVSASDSQYLLQPVIDSQYNVSLSLAKLSSSGVFNPGSVVNYPLGFQGDFVIPFGSQIDCVNCTASKNRTNVDQAFKIFNSSFTPEFADDILTSISVGIPAGSAQGGALILADLRQTEQAAISCIR